MEVAHWYHGTINIQLERMQLELCPGKENYMRYTNSREGENEQRFRVGKQIIKTYLEGVCAPRNIQVKDGYTYRKTLKEVPDIVIELPDGRTVAIDYVTGIRSNDRYAKQGYPPFVPRHV